MKLLLLWFLWQIANGADPLACNDDTYSIAVCNVKFQDNSRETLALYNMSNYDSLWDNNKDTGLSLPDETVDVTITIKLNNNYYFSEFWIWFTSETQDITDAQDDTLFDFWNITTDDSQEIPFNAQIIKANNNNSVGYGFEVDTTTTTTSNVTAIETYKWRIILEFETQKSQDYTNLSFIEIYAAFPTHSPTKEPTSPTNSPTIAPTTSPSIAPTNAPTVPPPTHSPTTIPTVNPTPAPTYALYLSKTARNENDTQSNFTYSTNVYPLSERNETYSTFTVPSNTGKSIAYCTTCLLAWSNIDVDIWVEGCDDYDFGVLNENGDVVTPGTFWSCNGTWVVETTANLVDWQQTYGRLEIWEVDDYGRKYRQLYFEFQWNDTTCMWLNGEEEEECDVLPLTGTTQYAAKFRWSMPKLIHDNRKAPLIIVWYDLLSVPYSLRPELNYTFNNLTFTERDDPQDFSLNNVTNAFAPYLITIGLLLLGFIVIMVVACVRANEAILKQDYMLDTRDIRTTYVHSITTLIAPQSDIEARSKFSCKRHGVWLYFVLTARIIYMFAFTFTTFRLLFVSINQSSFDMLDKYTILENERSAQLLNLSADLESYYYNETDRMETEVYNKEYYCYDVYVNETASLFEQGAAAQYYNHSRQMSNSLSSVDFNLTGESGIFTYGVTACSLNTSNGAAIGSSDPYFTGYTRSNTTSAGAQLIFPEYIYASEYNRNRTVGEYNFTWLETFLSQECYESDWCEGWTFIDSYFDNTLNTTINNSFHLLSSLADPINSNFSGVCFVKTEYDYSEFNFDSLSALENYTNYLESLYLSNYISDVNDLYSTLTNLYDSIKNIFAPTEGAISEMNYTMDVIIDSSADEFDIVFELKRYNYTLVVTGGSGGSSNTEVGVISRLLIIIECPGCPEGNFTNPYLEQVADYILSYNYSNLSALYSDVTGGNGVNLSDVVSVNAGLLDYPDVPEISLPFNFDFVDLSFLDVLLAVTLGLDVILIIYRWYKTAGIVAQIVRGKDVEIRLRYLQTSLINDDNDISMVKLISIKECCNGREICDKLLNLIIWGHDKIRHCGYNCWKFMFWIWMILRLIIIACVIYMAYILVDGVVDVDFIISLGTFDLLTVGLAAQRSLRNQVICTTALAYNNYTLGLLQDSRETYAQEKNEQAWDWNVDELERVDDYNAYFCTAWSAYQSTVRDVMHDESSSLAAQGNIHSSLETMENLVLNAFDQDTDTSLSVNSSLGLTSDTTLSIEIELPSIEMNTDDISCYWTISKIEFDWTFNQDGSFADSVSSVGFTIETQNENTTNTNIWTRESLDTNVYRSPSTTTYNDIEENNVEWDDIITNIRINFSNIEEWSGTYYLNEVTFYGSADSDCITCSKVTFYYWDFDASDTYVEMCPSVTPVHGLMHRGFVRDWLTDELIAAHKPFIKAIRSIALSPFAILFGASIILILVYLLAFGIEQILLRVNLLRENPYAKVPLVHAVNSDFYDPSMHDIDEHHGRDRYNKDVYFGNSSASMVTQKATSGGGEKANKNENENGGNAVTGADNSNTILSLEAGAIDVELELEKLEENLAKKKRRSKLRSPKIGSPKRKDNYNYKKDGEKSTVPESEEPLKHIELLPQDSDKLN